MGVRVASNMQAPVLCCRNATAISSACSLIAEESQDVVAERESVGGATQNI